MKSLDLFLDNVTRSRAQSRLKTTEENKRTDQDALVDCVTRAFVGSMPRRKAIKLVVAGVTGLAFTRLGFKAVWAQQLCNCNGVAYDPITQCCTTSGVQPKNPIVDLAACPNRVPNPDFVAMANGCGAEGGRKFPERFGPVNFKQCCDPHDICFGTCNSDRDGCDSDFLSCLLKACSDGLGVLGIISPRLLLTCNAIAATYFLAVQSPIGTQAYESAQKKACNCCGDSTCGCTPGVCGTFTVCAPAPGSPPNCYCFATAEGGGACSRDFFCSSTNSCTSSSQCGPGSVCVVNTCCGPQGYCTPVCSTTNSSTFVAVPQTLTTEGGTTGSGRPMQ
jgi:hypothetical protein